MYFEKKMAAIHKPALVRLWTWFLRFSRKTRATITMKLLESILYTHEKVIDYLKLSYGLFKKVGLHKNFLRGGHGRVLCTFHEKTRVPCLRYIFFLCFINALGSYRLLGTVMHHLKIK